MYFWCVWHDRPLCWGCDRSHYTTLFRPRRLPSVSQFCRRVKTARIERMIRLINERLSRPSGEVQLAFLDGKALVVTENSRDPDARTGRGNGTFSRGYKLHAMVAEGGNVLSYRVTSLNCGEPKVAQDLLAPVGSWTLVIADANYDSKKLYESIAKRGGQLLTKLKGRKAFKRNWKKIPPARRCIVKMWREEPETCWRLYRSRSAIERAFSAMTTFGGGLTHLPPWVRTLRRVERWVIAKLAIYHARLAFRQAAA